MPCCSICGVLAAAAVYTSDVPKKRHAEWVSERAAQELYWPHDMEFSA